MELTHGQIVYPIPFSSAAFIITSKEELSEAPLMSRKAPNAISLRSAAFSVFLTALCRAVSVDLCAR